MPRVKFLFLLMGLFVLAAAAVTAAAPMAQGNPPSSGGPAVDGGVPEGSGESVRSPSACSTPTTQNIRGKNVIFDQCYQRNFSHGGTNYSIETYYRETTNATNTAQCTAAENTAGRCEHELSNNDDSNGDNVNAVAMAAEAETAMRFYHDRGLDFLPGSSTTLQIYIAEDPRLGGTPTTGSIQIDDENIDNNDVLNKRLLAFQRFSTWCSITTTRPPAGRTSSAKALPAPSRIGSIPRSTPTPATCSSPKSTAFWAATPTAPAT